MAEDGAAETTSPAKGAADETQATGSVPPADAVAWRRPVVALAVIVLLALGGYTSTQTSLNALEQNTREADVLAQINSHSGGIVLAFGAARNSGPQSLPGLIPSIEAHADALTQRIEWLENGNLSRGLAPTDGVLVEHLEGADGLHAQTSAFVDLVLTQLNEWGYIEGANGQTKTTGSSGPAPPDQEALDAFAVAVTTRGQALHVLVDEATDSLRVEHEAKASNLRNGAFAGLAAVVAAAFLTFTLAITPLLQQFDHQMAFLANERARLEARVRARTSVLEKRTRQLERSNEELQEIATVAAHDLQEPLRSITSYMQLIEQRMGTDLDPTVKEYLDYALVGSARMKSLLGDLLQYTQVGSSDAELQRVELDDVLRMVRHEIHRRIAEANAEIRVDGPLPAVLGHARELGEVFGNLIANSITYRHPDRAPMIRISSAREGDRVHLRLQDNGIGIDPRYAGKVFQLFERLHAGTDTPGTGIGLALCRKVIEHHDGRIWLESDGSTGTTFHLLLHGPSTPREAIQRSAPVEPQARSVQERGHELI